MPMNCNRNKIVFHAVRNIVAFLIFFAAGGSTSAQAILPVLARTEVSGSYSYVRTSGGSSPNSFNLNGGSASLAIHAIPSFAVVAEFGAYRFSGLGFGLNSTMYSYLGGARYSVGHFRFGRPFAQILLGGARLNASSGGIQAGENGFAMAVGGGLDLPLGRHLAIRALQADYLMTRFNQASGASGRQNNIRLSTGIVMHFGPR